MRFKNFGLEIKDAKDKVTTLKCAARAKGPNLDVNVAYGDEVEIPELWAKPTRYANGARKPSPIEQLAPQLKPADDAERAAWEQIPAPAAPKTGAAGASPSAMSVDALVAQGLPRGIAETLVATYQAALKSSRDQVVAE